MTAILQKLILYWEYPFVHYALIAGVLIAFCSSLLGVTLVLKRFSFIGDGLSHVAFGAMAIAAVLQISNEMPLVMVITIVSAVLLLRTGQNTKIKGDAAVAMISGRRAGHRLSADEYFFFLGESFGRCVQHAVRLDLHLDTVPCRGVAVCRNVGTCCGSVYPVLQ